MKLVNRVSVFFLAALAVLLVVTSGGFYAIVRTQLVRQFEQELRTTLDALAAAVEIEPEDVSWQPREHTIALGAVQRPNEVHWVVIGDGRRIVDKSPRILPELIAQAQRIAARANGSSADDRTIVHNDWYVLAQRLAAPLPDDRLRDLDEFDDIVIVVARSAASLNANLHRLLLLVLVLPLGIWLLAAAVGRRFCRTALQPVAEMSHQARSMTGGDFHSRLPVSASTDELADLALAFNALLDGQQRAYEQQRRFTGDAAHELRTPLTVLLGQIDVALRQVRSPQESAATLRVLRIETVRLQSIVQSLLFLARADGEAVLPDAEEFSLGAWLPTYLTRWSEHPRHGDIILRNEAVGDRRIKASTTLLARLLDNLIENAFKYSPPGTQVEISTACDQLDCLLEVQDHGRGIAAEDQANIFHPFFRSRAAREAGIAGTGLGLSIAERIAVACGGQLGCTSALHQGSRFTLRLPAIPDRICEAERGPAE